MEPLFQVLMNGCEKWIFWILFLFLSAELIGQIGISAGAKDLTSLRTKRILDISEIPAESPVGAFFTGIQYDLPYQNTLGTPFFYNEQRLTGRITYQGRRYTGHEFLYDLQRDQLVVITYQVSGLEYIALNRDWVTEASLEYRGVEYRFVTGTSPLLENLGLPGGYYELVFTGEKLALVAKHSKELVFRADQSDHHQYSYQRRLLLILNGRVFNVTRERELLALFPENKREIRAIRKKLGVKYEGATSEQLRYILGYCEEIFPVSGEGI